MLHVIGGGSRNEILNQWTANAIGLPVMAGPSEATALGNIMLQAIAAGEAKDVASMRQTVRRGMKMEVFLSEDEDKWEAALRKMENL